MSEREKLLERWRKDAANENYTDAARVAIWRCMRELEETSLAESAREAAIADLDQAAREYAESASEREQLAQWMIAHSFATGHGDTFADLLKELSWQVAELRSAPAAVDGRKR